MRRSLLLASAALALSAPGYADDTITASKDSFLTQGSPDRNEGANPILRLQASGNNRALIGFDLTGVTLDGLQQATLILTISDISSNWSASGRPVRVHRLLETFTEGNGWNVGNSIRGSGPGVTWKCASDIDVGNQATDCAAPWNGGLFTSATVPAVLHRNGMTGEVAFDVTPDMAALEIDASEAVFLVKKENEGDAGRVEYFSREAADAAGDLNLAPRLILVSPIPNEPPIAQDDDARTARNRAVIVDVLANDSDPNNDPLTLRSVADPPHGSSVIDSGHVLYTPDADFVGSDSFIYTIEDNAGGSTTATVSITIGEPFLTTLHATKDAFLRQGSPNTSEGANTMLRVRQSGKNRALVQFDLSQQDLSGLLTAKLVFTVKKAADNWGDGRPVSAHRLHSDWAEGNGFNANGNTRGEGAGVTWNCASDQDVSDQSPDCMNPWDGGDYALATSSGFVHMKGMTGEASFDVTHDVTKGASFGWLIKKDDEGQSGRVEYYSKETDPGQAPRLILERIDLGNVPPVAADVAVQTFEGTDVLIDVLQNVFDLNGDALSITNLSDPPNGTATLEVDQTVTYTPDSAFAGEDSFTYTVSDGSGSATATVTVTVQPGPPPALVPAADEVTTAQGASVLVAVLENDVGLEPLRVVATAAPGNGTAAVSADEKTLSYKPNSGFVGIDSFRYTVEDAAGNQAEAEVTVTVEDAQPFAADDHAFAESGVSVLVDVLSNDTGDALLVTSVDNPVGGIATHDARNVTYTPRLDFVGAGGFDYTIEDVDGVTATAHVTVTVSASQNRDPVAVNDTAATAEAVFVAVLVLANDSDPDGDPLGLTGVSTPANGTAAIVGSAIGYTPNAGFDGLDTFTYTVGDGRGGSATASVSVTVEDDAIPPIITATVDPVANAKGWHDQNVTVTFDCQDAGSGIQSCTDAVAIATEGTNLEVTGEAFDHAGNSASATVTLRLDKTPPSVALSGAGAGRRGQTVLVTSPGLDNLALDSVTVAVDGVDLSTLSQAPFETGVTIPPNAIVGSLVSVVATARDLAGNTAISPQHFIEVLGGGFVTGEVYDDTRGLPLAGTTVSTETTDALGRFGLLTNDATIELRAERAGFTVVERVVTVDQVAGTVALDARLTPLDESVTRLGTNGGTAADTLGNFNLTVPSGALPADTDFRLTSVSGLGLKNVLPLGWSPLGSVDIEPADVSISSSTLRLHREDLTGLNVVLVRYDDVTNEWVVKAHGLTGDTFVAATIGQTGAYAFITPDEGTTAPPPPAVDDLLLGVEPVETFFGLSASSEVIPAVSPVSPEAMATGSVILSAPLALPSGTLVSARVEETFDSLLEGTLVSEPFSQEMPLYRFPLRGDENLHLDFPVAPSRPFTLDELREGRIHVEIETAPAFNRGVLVGGEGFLVLGEGDAELVVPAGALQDTVMVFVEARNSLSVGLGFEGLTFLAAAQVDLAGAVLGVPGTLSLPASPASFEDLFIAKLLFVSGQKKLRLIGRAGFAEGRISGDVDSGGTYLFFQASEPLAVIQGTITEGGTPARLAVVESSTSPFMDITPASGFYAVAAKLEATMITVRSVLTGNQAVSIVTPPSTSTVTLNLALTMTGPFVTEVLPVDGAMGVSLSPSVRVTFSEPIDPATISTTTVSLSKSGQTPVPGRVILGAGNLSVSFLPDENLEPVKSYVLTATSAIRDTTANPLLPFTSSFATLDDSSPELNPDALTVSFPDDDGLVTIEALAFSFEPGASVTIVNLTNGVVATGNVASDGSLFFRIPASITDELQIRILDASAREIVITKTEFRGPNGEVAIGRRGGKIAVGDFELEVPDGALPSASIFTLQEVQQTVLDALPLPDGSGGLGSAVEVNMGGGLLTEEAALTFPIPPAAPADADFVLVRKVEEQGETLYDVIDTAKVLDGKLKSESPPFRGILNDGFYLCIWFPTVPATGRNPMGAITGIARELDTSAVNPVEVPLSGVTVRVDEALQGGRYTATTNDEGRFVLFDALFGAIGPIVNLVARDPNGRETRAIAFEDPDVIARFGTLSRFTRAGDVVFDFPLSPPEPPRTSLTILLFEQNGATLTALTNGFATVGDELVIKLQFTQPPGDGTVFVDVSGQSVPMAKRPDEHVSVGGQDQPLFVFEGTFRPQQARAYTITAEGRDAFSNLLTQRKTFLAVQGGAGNDEPLDGAPAVISDSAIPRDGDEGVPVTQVLSVQFTEPVTNVTESTVTLTKLSNDALAIPIDLVATKRDGMAGPPVAEDAVVALTITPRQGLEFSQGYSLLFSTGIFDLPSSGQPSPLPLDDATNEIAFETFTPTKIGQAPIEATLVALATLDNLALVASQPIGADGTTGNLEVFDLSDPTQPAVVGDPSVFVGSMVRDIAVEENVLLADGTFDMAAVLSLNPRSGNSGLTLFDVTSRQSPFPYAGFVTTVVPGEGSDYQVDLHEGFAYVATASGGLKIVNLKEASSLFEDKLVVTTTAIGFGSIPFSVSQGLFSPGIGFGRQAIQNRLTIPDPAGAMEKLSVTTVKVDGTDQDRVGYVGGISLTDGVGRLSTVNLENVPVASVHATIALETEPDPIDGSTIHMSQPSDTAISNLGAQKVAILTGGPMVKNGRGTLALADVTNAEKPELLTVIELDGGWGTSLALGDDGATVFVSTTGRDTGEVDDEGQRISIPAQVEIYNLTDPTRPKLAGVVSGAQGGVSVEDVFLVSVDTITGVRIDKVGFRLDDLLDPVQPDVPAPTLIRPADTPADTFFVFDDAAALGTDCTFGPGTEIVFDIPVTRYTGERETDSTLKHITVMKAEGYVAPTATLEIMAYDVDSGAAITAPEPPEVDRVLFNGNEAGFLIGEHRMWRGTRLDVPIEWVKFPAKGNNGASPAGEPNQVRIQVDVANTSSGRRQWCTVMAWANLTIQALSPVVLVHGNNSDGDFFERNGFTEFLEPRNIPFDNSIDLVPNADHVVRSSEQLSSDVPRLVEQMGVDSIHLVVHSKGGLDARDYLVRYKRHDPDGFRVLSLTTLDTPHNGSVLADIQILTDRAGDVLAAREFSGFPDFVGTLASILASDDGTRNLTLDFTSRFNADNVPQLPDDIQYNVTAADTDDNGNGVVDALPAEYLELLNDSGLPLQVLDATAPAKAAAVVNAFYQTLRGTATVDITTRLEEGTTFDELGEEKSVLVRIATITSQPRSRAAGNDTMVEISSALGLGTLEPLVDNCLVFKGSGGAGILPTDLPARCEVDASDGRNHSSIANAATARRVLGWILERERREGDLKEP